MTGIWVIQDPFTDIKERCLPSFKSRVIPASTVTWFESNFTKVSLTPVLIVFTGLVMSGTSLGERLEPGTAVGLFAAVAVPGILSSIIDNVPLHKDSATA